MKIYFAGPLFCKAELDFNINLTRHLEALGFEVFLPQRDGIENRQPFFDRLSKEEKQVAIFEADRDAIFESDIFLFILDGRIPDEGACVELGMAYTHRQTHGDRLLIGYQSDSRAAFIGSKLNPMLQAPLDIIVDNEDDLFEELKNFTGREEKTA